MALYFVRTIDMETNASDFFIAAAESDADVLTRYFNPDGLTQVTEVELLTEAHIVRHYDSLALLCSPDYF